MPKCQNAKMPNAKCQKTKDKCQNAKRQKTKDKRQIQKNRYKELEKKNIREQKMYHTLFNGKEYAHGILSPAQQRHAHRVFEGPGLYHYVAGVCDILVKDEETAYAKLKSHNEILKKAVGGMVFQEGANAVPTVPIIEQVLPIQKPPPVNTVKTVNVIEKPVMDTNKPPPVETVKTVKTVKVEPRDDTIPDMLPKPKTKKEREREALVAEAITMFGKPLNGYWKCPIPGCTHKRRSIVVEQKHFAAHTIRNNEELAVAPVTKSE